MDRYWGEMRTKNGEVDVQTRIKSTDGKTQRWVAERGDRPSECVGILVCQPLPGLFPTLGLFLARTFLH